MQRYRVTGPDGATYEITAPSDEAATAAVQQFFGGGGGQGAPAPPAAPAPPTDPVVAAATVPDPAPPSNWQRFKDDAGAALSSAAGLAAQGAIGVRRGFSQMAGLPVDAVNNAPRLANLLNLLPYVDGIDVGPITSDPVGGSESIDRVLASPTRLAQTLFGRPAEDPAPQNAGERFSRRVGQEIGGAAVPAAGALGTAARVGVQGAREMGPLARTVLGVEQAAVNPGAFVGKEAAAATAAGIGAQGANELFNDGQQGGWSDPAGAVAGVTLSSVGQAVAKPLATAVGALAGSPRFADQVVRDVATDEIARAAGLVPDAKGVVDTEALARRAAMPSDVPEVIPGFQPSLADTTKNPGVAALEYGRQTGPNSGQYAQRRNDNAAAVEDAVNASAPSGTPGALRSELEARRDAQIAEAAGLRATAEDEATTAAAPLTPTTTQAQRGNTIRTGLEDARDTARARTEEAYRAADTASVEIDPTTLSATIDRATAGMTEVERGLLPQGTIDRVRALGQVETPGPIDTGIVDQFGRPVTRDPAPPDPVRLKEATDLLSELGRLERAALADPRAERGGRNAARVIGQVADALEGFVGRNLSDEQRQLLADARAARFAEAEAFGRPGDPVNAALARNEGGAPRMVDENVAKSFVPEPAMTRLFAQADTPGVRNAIREEVLSRADLSTPDGIRRFMEGYGPQIDRFPGLRQELDRALETRSAETMARGVESDVLKEIGPQGRGVVAKYLQYGDENAQKAMQSVLSSKDPARSADELLRFVGDDPQAVEGARKTFWDIMERKARSAGSTTRTADGSQPWLTGRLDAFVNDPANAAVAQRLYRDDPQHWQNIQKITETLRGVDVRNSGKAPNTSGTAQGQQSVLPSAETFASRIFAVERGVVSPAFAAVNVIGIMARRATKNQQIQAVNNVIDRALLDPQFAAALLRENNPANRAALARSAKGWLGNQTAAVLDLLEEKDPTTDAIMEK